LGSLFERLEKGSWVRVVKKTKPHGATEIVKTKYNARAWQWFSNLSLKAFVNRVNHLVLIPNGEVLSLGK
jgi:hypothetical protein